MSKFAEQLNAGTAQSRKFTEACNRALLIEVTARHGVDRRTREAVSEFCRRVPYAITLTGPVVVEILPTTLDIDPDMPPSDACVQSGNRVICSGKARLFASLSLDGDKAKIRVATTTALPSTTGATVEALAHALVHYEQLRDGLPITKRGVKLRCSGLRTQISRVHFCRYCSSLMRRSTIGYAENPFCDGCFKERVAKAQEGMPPMQRIREGNYMHLRPANDCKDPGWPRTTEEMLGQ